MSETTGIRRRGRFRFLYQFSLRTLLLATAGVAIFCNWYFQPKYHEEELAGKDLRVRQQMKTVQPEPVELPRAMSGTSMPAPPSDPQLVNHGHYTLLDGDDFVLARGRFADGSETGRWVTYYPTGHKAAEGKMHSGVKVGLWRTWYEDGTLASEMTYADKPVERFQAFRPNRPFVISVIPVYDGPNKFFDPHIDCQSSREGPAKAWYANGQLRYEGENRADQQEGLWKYYSEQGRLTASGPYRGGKRHGKWTISRSRLPSGTSVDGVDRGDRSRPAGRTYQEVVYIDGRTRGELDRLLGRLERRLESPQPYRRTQALIDLAEIGEGAVPVFQRRLTTDDPKEQLAILAVLPRMTAAAAPLLPRVRELVQSSEHQVSHQARLTLFQLDAASRTELYDTLAAEALAAADLSQCLTELVLLYRSDPSHRAELFAVLMSLPVARADADSEQIISAVKGLGGEVGPYIAAALAAKEDRMRLQAARTLRSLLDNGWRLETFVSYDEPTWKRLLAGLKSDPSPEVRALADEIGQGPKAGPFFGGGGGIF